ncbi:DUF4430 domain-containing protein [Periweissella cryptocerci]|uniref:DUF4430 domain-containing protein n=1 Tax=Periweissella cryptocerci TaxID=2506420 RepID=A0A4P6YSB3_9LACO|nr:DUF4430 domain-containing protein [Periweissella cryptocerci]QBO35578.1 DUF4430 domain-containing protein [Periweissella cryptocerci]
MSNTTHLKGVANMHKKWLFSILAVLLLLGIGGYFYHQSATPSLANHTAKQHVTISYQTKQVNRSKNITFTGSKTLLTLLKREPFNAQFTKDGFITAVAGIKQNPKRGQFWVYTVNNKQTSVSAQKLELHSRDKVKLELISYKAK